MSTFKKIPPVTLEEAENATSPQMTTESEQLAKKIETAYNAAKLMHGYEHSEIAASVAFEWAKEQIESLYNQLLDSCEKEVALERRIAELESQVKKAERLTKQIEDHALIVTLNDLETARKKIQELENALEYSWKVDGDLNTYAARLLKRNKELEAALREIKEYDCIPMAENPYVFTAAMQHIARKALQTDLTENGEAK